MSVKTSLVSLIAAIQQIPWMTRSGDRCCPFYLRISLSQRKFFLADSISHLTKNWNQIRSEIVNFLLVKNKMIQIGASLMVVGIPLKWHVSQTGQFAKKVCKAIFRENASKVKQSVFSPSSKRHKSKSSDTSTKDNHKSR